MASVSLTMYLCNRCFWSCDQTCCFWRSLRLTGVFCTVNSSIDIHINSFSGAVLKQLVGCIPMPDWLWMVYAVSLTSVCRSNGVSKFIMYAWQWYSHTEMCSVIRQLTRLHNQKYVVKILRSKATCCLHIWFHTWYPALCTGKSSLAKRVMHISAGKKTFKVRSLYSLQNKMNEQGFLVLIHFSFSIILHT